MTISELADKIHKTPAEIVKFLMFQGVMATVNQLIDVDVIKKVCAEYGSAAYAPQCPGRV